MAERQGIGFTAHREKEEPLVIPSADPKQFKKQLVAALEEIRKAEPSELQDANVDLLHRLINRMDSIESLQRILQSVPVDITIPGQEGNRTEKTRRRRLGFGPPENP